MSRRSKSVLFLTTAIGLGLTVPAAAQQVADTSDSSVQQIEQITVTATRRVERLQDVPISITVYDQQQLSNLNVVNAQDLAATTPSLSANSNFGSQNSSFAIRGFVQDTGTAPAVGVYFADVIEPRGASNGIPTGDGAGPGDFFDLQNVQVLKGPQGTLFGRNTTGGDVLLVPQKPTDEFGGYLEGSYGNYDMVRMQGVLNVPVSDDVRLRIGVDHQSRDGYLNNDTGIGPSHFDDVDYTSVRASLDVDVTSNLENYMIGSYTTSHTNGDIQKAIACDPTNTGPFTAFGGCGQIAAQGTGFYDAEQDMANPETVAKTWRVINTTTWTVSDDLTIKNIASYSQYSEKYVNPIFGTNFSTPALPANALYSGSPAVASYPYDFAASVPIPGGLTADEATYTEELQLQGKGLDGRLTWQAGVYIDASDPLATVGSQSPVAAYCPNSAKLECLDPLGYLEAASLPLGYGGPFAFPIPIAAVNLTDGTTSYRDQAAYAQATYKLSDQFRLTEGIRFTQDAESATSNEITYGSFPYPFIADTTTPVAPTPNNYGSAICTANPAAAVPGGCAEQLKEHSHAPTYLIDLDYTPSEDILAYAKYSRGYRAGVINPTAPEPYTYAHPETVNTYEVGAKTSWEGALSGIVDGDVFYNDFSNQQLQIGFNTNTCYTINCIRAPVGPFAAALNAGKSRIYGAELESTIVPYEGVTIHLGYTYLNTELTKVTTYPAPTITDLWALSGAQKVGDPLELSPRNKATVTAAYTLPIDEAIGKITASATFTHTDPMVTNYSDNTLTNPANYSGNGAIFASMNKVKATDLLNLNLNWNNVAGEPVDLSFFATNVTGEKFLTFIPGLAQGTGFETAEVGPPTMYGVRLRYTFGGN